MQPKQGVITVQRRRQLYNILSEANANLCNSAAAEFESTSAGKGVITGQRPEQLSSILSEASVNLRSNAVAQIKSTSCLQCREMCRLCKQLCSCTTY